VEVLQTSALPLGYAAAVHNHTKLLPKAIINFQEFPLQAKFMTKVITN
jgi:hypothetical protein